MDKLMNTVETCEDCYDRNCIVDMVVNDIPDCICIYCRKCTAKRQYLK